MSSSLLPNTTNWLIITKQARVFFPVTLPVWWWSVICYFRRLHSVKNTCPVTTFRMKFYPYHLILSDVAYHQILSYCSLGIIKTYLTGDFLEKFHHDPSCSGKPGLAQTWGNITDAFLFPVLLRALQNTQMHLLWSKKGIIWLWWTILTKAPWEIVPKGFGKTEALAICHTHTKGTSLHDFTIKEKTSKHIVTLKLKTMACIEKHLFQFNYRCELLIQTMNIIVDVFVLAHFVSQKT